MPNEVDTELLHSPGEKIIHKIICEIAGMIGCHLVRINLDDRISILEYQIEKLKEEKALIAECEQKNITEDSQSTPELFDSNDSTDNSSLVDSTNSI